MKTNRRLSILLVVAGVMMLQSTLSAQTTGDVLQPTDNQSLPTLFSVKLSGGYGFGRGREQYGYNGGEALWWSTGQGAKMDLAFDVPLLPIEVLNADDEDGPERFSIVGLELEFATGYHISTGGTTNDPLPFGASQTITRTSTYVPVTLGFNARTSFGAGLPSVYIGAGGGVHLKAIYESNIVSSNSTISTKQTYDPPLPFELYGAMGIEIPLIYDADDGNSMFDLFAQAKLTEATNYVYKFTNSTSDGKNTIVQAAGNYAHSASNVAFSLGIKFNIY